MTEEVRTPLDKCKSLPREKKGAYRGAPLWHGAPAVNLPMREGPPKGERAGGCGRTLTGVFPQRFLPWALRVLGNPARCLHVCSGALGPMRGAVRVDLRPEMKPDVVADGRALPLQDGQFDAALIDPPYSVEYAKLLYGTEYPRPSHLLEEAARCVRPNGRIGILHYLVPRAPARTSHLGVWGITTGCGYRIRAFTVYEKEQRRLW